MLILIYIQFTSIYLVKYFVIGKIRIMEFHQPPLALPTTLTTPLPIRHTQISMHICETMYYRVSIDYIYIVTVCQKWCLKKKITGGCNHPLRRTRVDIDYHNIYRVKGIGLFLSKYCNIFMSIVKYFAQNVTEYGSIDTFIMSFFFSITTHVHIGNVCIKLDQSNVIRHYFSIS